MSKIVGKEKVDYFSKKMNQLVSGVWLHVLLADIRVEGCSVPIRYIHNTTQRKRGKEKNE